MAPTGNPKQPWYHNIIAGAIAGVTEVLVMYPLDLAKTRLQLQKSVPVTPAAGGAPTVQYTGLMDALANITKQEGFFGMYRGIISPILAEAPKRAIKFTCNAQYKALIGDQHTWQHVASGALAGMTEALANCPFEVVKVRMQARENLGEYKSTGHALVTILRKEGPLALYNGLEPQLWRNAVWNGAYFSIINSVVNALQGPNKKENQFWIKFIAGTIAGGVATTLNTPFDVVKSRMQMGKSSAGTPKWSIPCLIKIFNEEGFKALFKGYVPRMVRLGPGGGIMIVVFDSVSEWLAHK